MTASQAYKAYVRKLASSGLPTCKAQLVKLAGMNRSEAFEWFVANKYQATPVVTAQDDVSAFLAEIGATTDAEIAPEIIERVSKPKAAPKAKATRKRKTTSGAYEFRLSLANRYGFKPVIGSTFKGKRGGQFTVTGVTDTHVVCAKG